jgi:RNase H-fold protein (predicted Holliday junction resolvase)
MMVLGIDPGTRKCGYAVVARAHEAPAELGIVATAELPALLTSLAARFALRAVALGSGTHAGPVARILEDVNVPVVLIDERATTLLARRRYFAAHPPRGWRRLVPTGMLLPPRPVDDYAAVLIAERLLERESGALTHS